MKKITLSFLALLPISLFAQAPATNGGGDLSNIFFVLLFCVLMFVVCREILCWYWKINKMVANQDEIIRLLKKIAGENNAPTNNTKLKEEKRDVIKELAESARFMITGK